MKEQTHEEFLTQRTYSIGASDAPILMGTNNKYNTPYSVWLQKTHRVPVETKMSGPALRGHELEPRARSLYSIVTGIDMTPTRWVHPKYEFITASYDGLNMDAKIALEIKCPFNRKDHELAIEGTAPEKYIDQLQHQYMVNEELEQIHYFSYDDRDDTYALIEVPRDTARGYEILAKELRFWDMVKKDEQPALMEQDYWIVEDKCIKDFFLDYTKEHRLHALARLEEYTNIHKKLVIGDYKIWVNKKGSTTIRSMV